MSAVWTAHRAPGDPPEATLLIADRWRWGALLFPVLWALWGRSWLLAFFIVIARLGLGALAATGFGAVAAGLDVALRLVLASEGVEATRIDRRLRGWREEGAVAAADADDAERAWFLRQRPARGPWGCAA